MTKMQNARSIIDNYIAQNGKDVIMTKQELQDLNLGVQVTDLCFNRYNNGFDPLKFDDGNRCLEWLNDTDAYKLVGSDYPYTGDVYHDERGKERQIVGHWENGKLQMFKSKESKRITFMEFYDKFKMIIDTRRSDGKKSGNDDKEIEAYNSWIGSGYEKSRFVISFQKEEYGDGSAKWAYVDFFNMLCERPGNLEILKEKKYFFKVNDETGKYTRYKNTDMYIYTNCQMFEYMVKSVKLLLDLNMYDKLREYSFKFEVASKSENKEKTDNGNDLDIQDNIVRNYQKLNYFSNCLIKSKNIIFRGAPGTGKSYLAKHIATNIVSDKSSDDDVNDQIEFVQFHPSYDYTDFVEGIRTKINPDGTMGFYLEDGVFKKFVKKAKENTDKKYVFIIDEINRGEISKIFGELFFSIDPGYRGKKEWAISTQYSNLHDEAEGKFYIPENVYIIGTMNDIDRSVDSFDFAMRRRFRFIEITVKDSQDMLDELGDNAEEAKSRMDKLNQAILDTEELNENYQIGAAYFLKLKSISYMQLWNDYLKPLLQEYVHGMNDETTVMKKYEDAYNNPKQEIENEDQG